MDALDAANGGMVTTLLEILEGHGTAELEALARYARPPSYRGRPMDSWRAALYWVAHNPPGQPAHRWENISTVRLKRVEEAMREALTISCGGQDELSRRGLQFAGFTLPPEVVAALEEERWKQEGDVFFAEGAGQP